MKTVEYTEEMLNQVEQYASIYLKISDIAVLFDIPAEQLREDIADRSTEVSKRYHKGKAASMLVLGSLLLIFCHLTFAFVLPLFEGSAVGGIAIAYITILVLGSSFSLVPASLWPSVPKLVDAKVIGSAYALIFWIQNIGLWLFPLLIGKVLDKTNPGVTDPTQFDYTAPLVMLACLGVAALLLCFVLKVVDKKKGLGLEEPNIK